MNILLSKPFLYKVIHRRSVKSKLKKARSSLYDATNVFQVRASTDSPVQGEAEVSMRSAHRRRC